LAMRSKFLARLASGRPVIATAPPESEIAAKLADSGIITPPEEPVQLAAAVVSLAGNAAARRRMGTAATALARDCLQTEKVLGRLEAQLVSLAGYSCASGLGVSRETV